MLDYEAWQIMLNNWLQTQAQNVVCVGAINYASIFISFSILGAKKKC